jgi:hypothetical protein
LADIAREMITRVRDDAPADVWRWLRLRMADLASADPVDDWIALSVIQAAATPDDRKWTDLVAWIETPESPVERRRRQWRESQYRRSHPQRLWIAVEDGAESVETAVHNGSGVQGSVGQGAA